MNPSLRERMSAAAHAGLPHANPLSVMQIRTMVDEVAARKPRTALDIGCGPGSLSLMLAQRCPVNVLAIDVNPDFLERARRAASDSTLPGRVVFSQQAASELGEKAFDAVICIGASHAFGTPAEAVSRCAGLLNPGGTLLFAELAWKSAPPEQFLAFLGCDKSFYWRDEGSPAPFVSSGLRIRKVERASASSWEKYEDAVHRGRLAFAATLPPEEARQVREVAKSWSDAYARWGKPCLGFTAYLATREG